MPDYYPLMLDLRGRLAMVIGGDHVAAEKAASLAASGANVHAQSPTFSPAMAQLAEQQKVTLHQKAYERGDVAGAFVVIAATNDAQLIQTIWAETQESGQLLNIVDVPQYCNFILPSILRRGQLTIAVSTEGASPGLAKRIRHELEAHFPPTYGTYIRLASVVRKHLRTGNVSYQRRDDFFGDFFNSTVLAQIVAGNVEQAIATTGDLLQRYGIELSTSNIAAELIEDKRYVNSNA